VVRDPGYTRGVQISGHERSLSDHRKMIGVSR
jgi:hypothetical protein